MRYARTAIGTAALSLLLVIGLAQLYKLEEQAPAMREQAAFQPMRAERLSDDNLTDAMISLPLRLQLARVAWDHAILSVDLTVEGDGGQAETWQDAEELIRFSFRRATNVKQLLLRVFRSDVGARTLLLAADTRSGDWTPEELDRLALSPGGPDRVVQTRLRLVLTPEGRRWLLPVAIS